MLTLLEDLAWLAFKDGIGDELDDDVDDSVEDEIELELGVNSLSKSISLSSAFELADTLDRFADWFNLFKLALDWTKCKMCAFTSEFF